jgi:hypothetical protein
MAPASGVEEFLPVVSDGMGVMAVSSPSSISFMESARRSMDAASTGGGIMGMS